MRNSVRCVGSGPEFRTNLGLGFMLRLKVGLVEIRVSIGLVGLKLRFRVRISVKPVRHSGRSTHSSLRRSLPVCRHASCAYVELWLVDVSADSTSYKLRYSLGLRPKIDGWTYNGTGPKN